jgi:hypothetical protein
MHRKFDQLKKSSAKAEVVNSGTNQQRAVAKPQNAADAKAVFAKLKTQAGHTP